MKVVAFNGSPRPAGNTAASLGLVFAELARHGIETELVQVGGVPLRGCQACYACVRDKVPVCAITDDPVNEWIGKIMAADGIILASPVYFNDVTSEMKAFIDRAGFVARANGRMFSRKIGAAVAVMRRSGAVTTADTLLHFLLIMRLFIVGGVNHVVANNIGEFAQDAEGVENMQVLGANMAELLKMQEAYRRR